MMRCFWKCMRSIVLLVVYISRGHLVDSQGCDFVADVIFLLDGSPNITLREFRDQQKFAQTVIRNQQKPVDVVRFSAAVCGGSPSQQTDFDSNTTAAADSITLLGRPSSPTAHWTCLQLMETKFAEEGRNQTAHISILIAGGSDWTGQRTKAAMKSAKVAGVRFVVISVGSRGLEHLIALHSAVSDDVDLMVLPTWSAMFHLSPDFFMGSCHSTQ